jgi:hypothetical protein
MLNKELFSLKVQRNKLERLSLANFADKYSIWQLGWDQTLLIRTKLGGECLSGANTLAYFGQAFFDGER